ncbi:MAG: hypothetical protein RL112_2670 [Planctomycetota bacterium]
MPGPMDTREAKLAEARAPFDMLELACPLCGPCGSEPRVELERGGRPWRLRRCNYCNLVFLAQRPRDWRAARGADAGRAAPSASDVEEARGDVEAARSVGLSAPRRVLLAGGDPAALEPWRTAWPELEAWVASDDPRDVADARRRGMHAVEARLEDLACTPGELLRAGAAFDAIVCADSLDERDDPRASLAALRALARDGGLLVVRGVDCGGAQERRFRQGAWHAYDPPRRAHHFNPFNLARLAGGEGFEKKLVQALPDARGWIRSWRAELARRGAASDVVELLRDEHPVFRAWFGFVDRRAARLGRRTSRLRLVAAARPGPAPGAGNSFAPAARAPAR